MFVKLKSDVFIDTVTFELGASTPSFLKAVLSDSEGKVCNSLQTNIFAEQKFFHWRGLNDLPYGVYTLELFSDKEKEKMKLVKRV